MTIRSDVRLDTIIFTQAEFERNSAQILVLASEISVQTSLEKRIIVVDANGTPPEQVGDDQYAFGLIQALQHPQSKFDHLLATRWKTNARYATDQAMPPDLWWVFDWRAAANYVESKKNSLYGIVSLGNHQDTQVDDIMHIASNNGLLIDPHAITNRSFDSVVGQHALPRQYSNLLLQIPHPEISDRKILAHQADLRKEIAYIREIAANMAGLNRLTIPQYAQTNTKLGAFTVNTKLPTDRKGINTLEKILRASRGDGSVLNNRERLMMMTIMAHDQNNDAMIMNHLDTLSETPGMVRALNVYFQQEQMPEWLISLNSHFLSNNPNMYDQQWVRHIATRTMSRTLYSERGSFISNFMESKYRNLQNNDVPEIIQAGGIRALYEKDPLLWGATEYQISLTILCTGKQSALKEGKLERYHADLVERTFEPNANIPLLIQHTIGVKFPVLLRQYAIDWGHREFPDHMINVLALNPLWYSGVFQAYQGGHINNIDRLREATMRAGTYNDEMFNGSNNKTSKNTQLTTYNHTRQEFRDGVTTFGRNRYL